MIYIVLHVSPRNTMGSEHRTSVQCKFSLTRRADMAAEHSNYPLVLALNACIREGCADISKSLGNAALGRY